MIVHLIFDEAFEGALDGPVWIIDTPANRQWFNAQEAHWIGQNKR
jgi:hypothetical protein